MTVLDDREGYKVSRVVAMTTNLFYDDEITDEDNAGYLDVIVTALVFDPADPYAVTMTAYQRERGTKFDTDRVFARDLLAAGTTNAVGDDEIGVGPDPAARGWMAITIHPGQADATPIYMQTADVTSFLAETYAAVPAGREGDGIDWETTITALLAAP